MTDQEARYDTIAEGYAACWSPVHRPRTLALLDEVEPAVAAGATRILDIGCGTGAFAAGAVARWPRVRVTGVDVSAGMLRVANRELGTLPAGERDRIDLVQAPADRLPFDDGAFDVAASAFVLQLVPSRHRALREARRVLAHGGTLATLTWLAGGEPLAADDAYDDALGAYGFEPRESGGGGDDPDSPEATAAAIRRAGFERVTARAGTLEHAFSPDSFLEFLARFDDQDLFESMDGATREAFESDLLARLRALPEDGLRMRLRIAYATARRPARP